MMTTGQRINITLDLIAIPNFIALCEDANGKSSTVVAAFIQVSPIQGEHKLNHVRRFRSIQPGRQFEAQRGEITLLERSFPSLC